MHFHELLQENHLPILDDNLALSVIDSAIGLGFDLSDMAAPSSFDDTEESDNEDERLEANILASMHQQWESEIEPAIQGDFLNVYRAVSLSSAHSLKTDSLGKHWTTSVESAYPYWGSPKHYIVLHALVGLEHIDWAETFALHIQGGENEIRLYNGTPVKIVKIEWQSDRNSGHLDDDNVMQKLIGKTFTI